MSEKQNKLALAETLKLSDWFARNEEWLKTERPDYKAAAERATKDLGFVVTRANVKAVNDARGVYVNRLNAARERMSQAIEVAVAKALAPALARLAELEDVVARLCKGLGEKPPRGTGAESVRIVPPPANGKAPELKAR